MIKTVSIRESNKLRCLRIWKKE
uniref:Uncharacterized protein n=1 Tax=Anguilla anguilla TaxID=7936 RepID=A0A0E9PRT1_ANGAN